MRTLLGVALGGAIALPAGSQALSADARSRPAVVPFQNGEMLTYDLRFGAIKIGTGRMRVLGQDSVRDRFAWHVRFSVTGGTFFYKVNDVYESWMDTETLNSLRYRQDLNQGSRERQRIWEIYPERATYRELTRNGPERPSVSSPLDDGSFLYFVRTVPLEVGQTYSFNRYFRPDRNPVIIRVLRRERVRVPAGEFDAIVIQPIIKTVGIFAEGGQAEIWLSDDDRRLMIQMKTRMSFGTLNLFLRSFRLNDSAEPVGIDHTDSLP